MLDTITLDIEVTQEDIDGGKINNMLTHPIALAVTRAAKELGLNQICEVDTKQIRLGMFRVAKSNPEVTRILFYGDLYNIMSPFKTTIDFEDKELYAEDITPIEVEL